MKKKTLNGGIENLIYGVKDLKELYKVKSNKYFEFDKIVNHLNWYLHHDNDLKSFIKEYNKYFQYNGRQMLMDGNNNNDKMIHKIIDELDTSFIEKLYNEYGKIVKKSQQQEEEIRKLKQQLQKMEMINKNNSINKKELETLKKENELLKLEIKKLSIKKPTREFSIQTDEIKNDKIDSEQQTDMYKDYKITKENNIDIKNQQKNKDYKIIKNNNISFYPKEKKTIGLDAY